MQKFQKIDKYRLYCTVRTEDFDFNSKTDIQITQKARDQYVDERNTQFDYSMFHYRKGFKSRVRHLKKN